MPKFTVFIHASGVEGLDQTLRAARIAPDILVIHSGDSAVEHLCLRHGARSKVQVPGVTPGAYAMDAFYDWLLLLEPGEDLSEDMRTALATWMRQPQDDRAGYLLRGGASEPSQLRFVNRAMLNWIGEFPPVPTNAGVFPGLILRARPRQAA
jgi:hypothetical protein